MKKGLVIFVTFLIAFSTPAQKWASDLWHEGQLILDTGDTLRGIIKYDFQKDLLQYGDKQGSTEAFTARKVLYFQIFDKTASQYRSFYALPYSSGGGYKTPVFFELLVEGKITLLSRENLEYRTYSSPYYYYGSYTRLVLINRFYFLEENGDITEFVGKKSDLLSLMGRYGQDVDQYMRKNKLKIEDKEDFASVVTYYNSFF